MKSTIALYLAFLLTLFISDDLFADTIVSEGVIYRSVPDIASKLGMKLNSSEKGKIVTLQSKWTKIEFTRGSRIIKLNNSKVFLGFPSFEHDHTLFIPELDWQFTISPILLPPELPDAQRTIQTIIIDPGHGGKDPGAQNTKEEIDEKNLTLEVAKLLEKRLQKIGYKVYLTRKSDKFIELGDRPALARKRKADLFISIHFNSSQTESAQGIESYAYTLLNQPSTSRSTTNEGDKIFRRANRNDSLNILLAYYTQNNLIAITKDVDRGLKRARFTVLEDLQCPGVLVELGFVRNPDTAKKLKTKKYLDQLAAGLTNAIVQYHNRIKPS